MHVSFGVALLAAILAGFIGAMSGLGGGVVLTPVLTLFGYDIKHAIALSALTVIATSSGSAAAYVRDRITNIRIGMFLEMFTIIGALIGATITLSAAKRPLFIAFGLVLLFSWATSFFQKPRTSYHPATPDRISRWLALKGEYYDLAERRSIPYHATNAIWGGLILFCAGVIAGLLGIGAGAVKVLAMDRVMGLPPKVSTTTSNFIIGVTALAGTSVYLASGLIDSGLAGPTVLGVLGGSFLATRLLVRLSNRTVRTFFLFVFLLIGIQMIIRGIGGYV
ncbi:sulfite exporter TauE/SafE family protein [Thermorudis peleae]|uniref:sulfite exporter TauE/SafE family protein n=1 Tax=Thermorudis peleae TaxID=1382356 RepID=UPI00056ED3E3|nr:sulfite exporter TauE/SafE family protein [Thermorudis peleae]MBX6755271.1 sulfite exporter TauE/SafE family protein [Thermorudis peleae]